MICDCKLLSLHHQVDETSTQLGFSSSAADIVGDLLIFERIRNKCMSESSLINLQLHRAQRKKKPK